MQLPIIKDIAGLLKWKAVLDPVIATPMAGVTILSDVQLQIGTNVINHKLGKAQSGWFLVDLQGVATIYRSQPFNDLTLTLVSSAQVTVDIAVF